MINSACSDRTYLVRGLHVIQPCLLERGNLVHVHAVDEPLHTRKQDHHLLIVSKQIAVDTEEKFFMNHTPWRGRSQRI